MLFFCLFAVLVSVQSVPQFGRDDIPPRFLLEVPKSSFPSGDTFSRSRECCNVPVYIPYKIENNFSKNALDTIYESLKHFEDQTCLSFVETREDIEGSFTDQKFSIVFLNLNHTADCFNRHYLVGKERGTSKVAIFLNEKSCLNDTRRIKQLIFGALGFIHEDLRPDRDDYVTILWDNIQPGREKQFRKVKENVKTWVLPYDYDSISHHYSDYYSKDGLPTLSSKNPSRPLSRTTKLSVLDLYKINSVYWYCKANTSKTSVASLDKDIRDQFVIHPLDIPDRTIYHDEDDFVDDDDSKEDLTTTTDSNSFTVATSRVENDVETTENKKLDYDVLP